MYSILYTLPDISFFPGGAVPCYGIEWYLCPDADTVYI